MDLSQAIAQISGCVGHCADGLPCAMAQTGERYIVIGCAGLMQEGECSRGWVDDPAIAAKLWTEAVIDYATGAAFRAGHAHPSRMTLYWRIKPEMNEIALYERDEFTIHTGIYFRPKTFFNVYSRLLVSDKPVIYADMASYERGLVA